jgi:hypothetical protein
MSDNRRIIVIDKNNFQFFRMDKNIIKLVIRGTKWLMR